MGSRRTNSALLIESARVMRRVSLRSGSFRRFLNSRYVVPFLYLTVGLATTLYLCFLVPPMQSRDEGRHFLRAAQIAHGHFMSQIDPVSGEAGGILPIAESEFVRDKMSTDFLRSEDGLRTIPARLAALDLAARGQAPSSEQRFAAFPGATIYSPALYLPQILGIRAAALFSNKVYIFFYSARVLNAMTAVILVFLALYLAPTHHHLLLIPAVLPMSLYQFSSVSSDASIIALSVLFVALCIRFLDVDGFSIRAGLLVCVFLLTLGKPVHLPASLLLLAAHKRLGWRRAILFFAEVVTFCGAAYFFWSYTARAFFSTALPDAPGRNPVMQIHSITAHPAAMMTVFLTTLNDHGWSIIGDMIGWFGWFALPLPIWLYLAALGTGVAVLGCLFLNCRAVQRSCFVWGCSAALSVLLAVCLASYVLWTPPKSIEVHGIQGRYLLPTLAILAFVAPPLSRFHGPSRVFMRVLTVGFFLLSAFWTVRIVDHFYFPRSKVLGQNVYKLYNQASAQSCPASIQGHTSGWFSLVESGRTAAHDSKYRVVLAEDNGTIVGESDSILIGTDPAQWRVNMWTPRGVERIHSWFIVSNSACAFGDIEVRPHPIPSA
jgi:predicted membrane protein DUF2142